MKIRLATSASVLLLGLMGQSLVSQGPPGPGQQNRIQTVTVQPDRKVTFRLSAPKAGTVSVGGSYPLTSGRNFPPDAGRPSTIKNVAMTKDDKGVWSATVGPLKPDIYDFHFIVDGLEMPDPQGHNSSSFILRGQETANYEFNANVPHGRVSYDWYPSPTLKMTRRLAVYTPPGYQGGTARYPVLYLLHWGGGDELGAIKTLRLPDIMDNMIAQGKVTPMIVVMPNTNTYEPLAASDNTSPPHDPGGQGGPKKGSLDPMMPFPNSLVHDILPYIDHNYRTKADRNDRAIAGMSLGGTYSMLAGFEYLDQFAWMGELSGGIDAVPNLSIQGPMPPDADTRRGASPGQSIDTAKFAEMFPVIGSGLNTKLHLLYISIGDQDGLLEPWQAAKGLFDEKGVKYVWFEEPGYGHDGSTWRVALQDFLPRLFKPAK